MKYKPEIRNLDDNIAFLEHEIKIYQENLDIKNNELRLLNITYKEAARMMKQNQPGNVIENVEVVNKQVRTPKVVKPSASPPPRPKNKKSKRYVVAKTQAGHGYKIQPKDEEESSKAEEMKLPDVISEMYAKNQVFSDFTIFNDLFGINLYFFSSPKGDSPKSLQKSMLNKSVVSAVDRYKGKFLLFKHKLSLI